MISVNDRPCHRAELHVPWAGRWVAKVATDGASLSGRVTLQWGSAVLVGGVDPTGGGTWQGEAFATIVGGPGWANVLPAQWIQNDAGLSGFAVAQQLARLTAETLQAQASAFRALRVSYSRPKRAAAVTLQDVLAKGAAWWVEYDGTTKAGTRSSPAAPSRVEVLQFDALEGWADLDANDVSQTLVGSVIAADLPRRPAFRIVELRAEAGAKGQFIRAGVEVQP